MGASARAGTCLEALVKIAAPLLREAERRCPRTGPGAKPEIPDWLIGMLIMVAVLKRRKSKSAQFRFLSDKTTRCTIATAADCDDFPSRSTFFRRYKRAHRLFREAIRLQGELRTEWTQPRPVSPRKHRSRRRRDQLEACTRLFEAAGRLFPQAAYPWSAWEGWLESRFHVTTWGFPARFPCTAIQQQPPRQAGVA